MMFFHIRNISFLTGRFQYFCLLRQCYRSNGKRGAFQRMDIVLFSNISAAFQAGPPPSQVWRDSHEIRRSNTFLLIPKSHWQSARLPARHGQHPAHHFKQAFRQVQAESRSLDGTVALFLKPLKGFKLNRQDIHFSGLYF